MARYVGVDSLSFLSIEGLYDAVGRVARNNAAPQFSDHCFTGDYPTPLTDLAGRKEVRSQKTVAAARNWLIEMTEKDLEGRVVPDHRDITRHRICPPPSTPPNAARM